MSSDEPPPDTPSGGGGHRGKRKRRRGRRQRPEADLDARLGWDPWSEAAALEVGAANLGVRAVAFFIDWVLLYMVMAVVAFVAVYNFGLGAADGATPFAGDRFTFNLVSGLIEAAVLLLYFGVLEHRSGQTLGKRLFGIEVVRDTGGRPPVGAGFLRRLPFVVGAVLPGDIGLLVLVGVSVAALVTAARDHRRKQGFHDRWAGTIVRRIR